MAVASKTSTVPDCSTAEMGSYSGQVSVYTPKGKPVGIDMCLLKEITELWSKGITTHECCCGHSVTTGYISVDDADITAMEALGYQHEDRQDGDQCFFIPKTPPHSDAVQDEHKRYEVWDGGNTWIQCSKQTYERAKMEGKVARILYER